MQRSYKLFLWFGLEVVAFVALARRPPQMAPDTRVRCHLPIFRTKREASADSLLASAVVHSRPAGRSRLKPWRRYYIKRKLGARDLHSPQLRKTSVPGQVQTGSWEAAWVAVVTLQSGGARLAQQGVESR